MLHASFQAGKIPATVISGFLGSGKTTMIRKLLEDLDSKRIALIVNEFGNLGVDGSLLKGCGIENCHDENVIELNNGCICCTVAEDFIPAMVKLLSWREPFDHIVIETSGLALPQPLIAAFNWPEIRTQVTVDAVITVIDASAVDEGCFANNDCRINTQFLSREATDHNNPLEELFEDQIQAADLIVLNKIDLLTKKRLESVRKKVISYSTRQTKMVLASYGNLGSAVLLGLGIGTEEDIGNRKSHHELYHANETPHSHDAFCSFIVEIGSIEDPKDFTKQLKHIIADYEILRLKGFIDVPEKQMRLVLQVVGSRIDYYFDRPWKKNEKRITRLVIIGIHDINQIAIKNAIAKAAKTAHIYEYNS
ncbi:MAG: cobalamin biosynthesis protein CobW [Candidatus Tokpelaia sp. JSC188]|nr:MAG: cobalamin biosynthesis protein CobW [Candidatus Tokpelaia sp. JSC188]